MFKVLNLLILIFVLAAAWGFAQKSIPKPTPSPTVTSIATTKKLESLKTLPAAQRYTSRDKTFSIWLPAEPKSVEVTPPADPLNGSTKTQYKWDVDEAFFAVTLGVYTNRSFTTDEDVNGFLALLKANLIKTEETRIVSEKPYTQGKWRGADITLSTGDWIKTLVRVMMQGNEFYTVTATIDANIPDAEKLATKAMNSFKISEK